MRYLFLILLFAVNINVMAQQKLYDVSKDSANGSLVFNGIITMDDVISEPSFTWMKTGVEQYKPDEKYLGYLSQNMPNYTLVVFIGTWCDDSHYWLPKLAKVLQAVNYPLIKLKMYGVNRAKTTKFGEQANFGITFVPTIIILKDGAELGRITESPKNGLEFDMQEILHNEPKLLPKK